MPYPSLDAIRDRTDIDLGPAADPDVISDNHGGDICPMCGDALRYDQQVVRSDGTRGIVGELAPEDVSVPLFCPECWPEVAAAVNQVGHRTLDEFAGGEP